MSDLNQKKTEAMTALKNGKSTKEVAKEFGITVQTLYAWKKAWNFDSDPAEQGHKTVMPPTAKRLSINEYQKIVAEQNAVIGHFSRQLYQIGAFQGL